MSSQSAVELASSIASRAARRRYRIKIAREPWELEEIHRLNHAIFTGEIPQHRPNPSGRLVDKFHGENTYVVALCGNHVVAMTAVRGNRPFSLDEKVPGLDSWLPPGRHPCEIRLLAVRPEHRSGRLLQRLLAAVWRFCIRSGWDLALISGTTRQLKLYRHLGFVPFGPLVGSAEAPFRPMMMTLEGMAPRANRLLAGARHARSERSVNLLPGPVPVVPAVQAAFAEPAVSHRSARFASDLSVARAAMCRLTGARHAQILLGSGTLANDAIAGQLSLLGERGLVLSNGEFGERLVDHARRFGLDFQSMRWSWGEALEVDAVARRLGARPRPGWIWCVAHETSTGVANDVAAIRALCVRAGAKLCVDSVSAVGSMPVDLSGVYFGSAVSGKGLGAFAGLAMVLHNHRIRPSSGRLPRYLDLAAYAGEHGVPYTHSSNLLRALEEALLARGDWEGHFREVADRTRWLRRRLRRLGLEVVAPERVAAPGIVSVVLPPAVRSVEVGAALEERGYAIAANSDYLLRRNWIQICTMARPSYRTLREIVSLLVALVRAPGGGRHDLTQISVP